MSKFGWSKIDYGEEEKWDEVSYYAYYKKEELGEVSYHTEWKKWIWCQREGIIMSLSCMENVVKKLKELEECLKVAANVGDAKCQ